MAFTNEPLLGRTGAGGVSRRVMGWAAASAVALACLAVLSVVSQHGGHVRHRELLQVQKKAGAWAGQMLMLKPEKLVKMAEQNQDKAVKELGISAKEGTKLGFMDPFSYTKNPFPTRSPLHSEYYAKMDHKALMGWQPKAVVWGDQDGPQSVADGHPIHMADEHLDHLGDQDGPKSVVDGHPIHREDPDHPRYHTGFRRRMPFNVADYAYDDNQNGVRRNRAGFYMDWAQGKDDMEVLDTAGFEDKAPTMSLVAEDSRPVDYDPFPYAVESSEHAAGEQHYGPEGSRPDDDPVKSKEPWPFARAPRTVQLAQRRVKDQQLTMRQDKVPMYEEPNMGGWHGCKPEQIALYPSDDCDPLLTKYVYPAEKAIADRLKNEPYNTWAHVHVTAGDVPPEDDFLAYRGQHGAWTGWKDAESSLENLPEPTMSRPQIAVGPGNLNFPIGTKGESTQQLSKAIDMDVAKLFHKFSKPIHKGAAGM